MLVVTARDVLTRAVCVTERMAPHRLNNISQNWSASEYKFSAGSECNAFPSAFSGLRQKV